MDVIRPTLCLLLNAAAASPCWMQAGVLALSSTPQPVVAATVEASMQTDAWLERVQAGWVAANEAQRQAWVREAVESYLRPSLLPDSADDRITSSQLIEIVRITGRWISLQDKQALLPAFEQRLTQQPPAEWSVEQFEAAIEATRYLSHWDVMRITAVADAWLSHGKHWQSWETDPLIRVAIAIEPVFTSALPRSGEGFETPNGVVALADELLTRTAAHLEGSVGVVEWQSAAGLARMVGPAASAKALDQSQHVIHANLQRVSPPPETASQMRTMLEAAEVFNVPTSDRHATLAGWLASHEEDVPWNMGDLAWALKLLSSKASSTPSDPAMDQSEAFGRLIKAARLSITDAPDRPRSSIELRQEAILWEVLWKYSDKSEQEALLSAAAERCSTAPQTASLIEADRSYEWRNATLAAAMDAIAQDPTAPSAAATTLFNEITRDFSAFTAWMNRAINLPALRPAVDQLQARYVERFQDATASDQGMTVDQFEQVAHVLQTLLGKDHVSTFAEGVLRYLNRGGRLAGGFRDFHTLGRLCNDPTSIDRLRAGIVDDQGLVHLPIAKTLAWAYSSQSSETLAGWRNYLEQQAQKPELTNDQKASWMLARAYAAQAVPADLSAVVGWEWIEQAATLAQSDELIEESVQMVLRGEIGPTSDPAQRRQQLLALRDQMIQNAGWGKDRDGDRVVWRFKQIGTLNRLLGELAPPDERAAFLAQGMQAIDPWYVFHTWEFQDYQPENRYWNAVYGVVKGYAQTLDDPVLDALHQRIVNGETPPQTFPLFILTWEARERGVLSDWTRYLDERVASSEPGSDAKLNWLLTRAFAEEIRPQVPVPTAGRAWIDEALADAMDEEVQIQVVSVLYQQLMSVSQYAEAASLLESFRPIVTSELGARRLNSLAGHAGALKAADDTVRTLEAQRVERSRLLGRIALLQERIESARQRGASDRDLNSLKNVLDQAQQELQALSGA